MPPLREAPPAGAPAIHSAASLSRAGRAPHGASGAAAKTNQDAALVLRTFAPRRLGAGSALLAAVLDGHGPHGHLVSSFVRAQLPGILELALAALGGEAPAQGGGAPSALRCALLAADGELLAAGAGIDASYSGTTAVAALIQGRRLAAAWVGDSRAVLVRSDGYGGSSGLQLTTDHKPDSPRERKRILAAGGRVERMWDAHGRRVGPARVWLPRLWAPGLAMSRALGDTAARRVGVSPDPETLALELAPRDRALVLATDGVWDVLSADEAAALVEGAACAEAACAELVAEAARRWREESRSGSVDDITAVVVKLQWHADPWAS